MDLPRHRHSGAGTTRVRRRGTVPPAPVGERRVRAALVAAIEPFQDRAGAVAIHNVFRYVVGVKP